MPPFKFLVDPRLQVNYKYQMDMGDQAGAMKFTNTQKAKQKSKQNISYQQNNNKSQSKSKQSKQSCSQNDSSDLFGEEEIDKGDQAGAMPQNIQKKQQQQNKEFSDNHIDCSRSNKESKHNSLGKSNLSQQQDSKMSKQSRNNSRISQQMKQSQNSIKKSQQQQSQIEENSEEEEEEQDQYSVKINKKELWKEDVIQGNFRDYTNEKEEFDFVAFSKAADDEIRQKNKEKISEQLEQRNKKYQQRREDARYKGKEWKRKDNEDILRNQQQLDKFQKKIDNLNRKVQEGKRDVKQEEQYRDEKFNVKNTNKRLRDIKNNKSEQAKLLLQQKQQQIQLEKEMKKMDVKKLNIEDLKQENQNNFNKAHPFL